MKRSWFISVLFCFVFIFSQAQNNPVHVKIYGKVSNKTDLTAIPNCTVILKTDDKTLQLTKTDAEGNYSFEFINPVFQKGEIYTETDKNLKTLKTPFGFLASNEKGKFIFRDTSEIFKKDFFLHPISCGPELPRLYFNKNSTEFGLPLSSFNSDDSIINLPENVILEMTTILKENPTLIIEISAHRSTDELFPDKLSQLRAEKVKNSLIQKGIQPERLIAKGYGETKLLISDAQIKKVKTKEEKEALHARNRRCVFKVLSWDYVDPNSPDAKIKKNTPVRGEEDADKVER